MKANIALWWAIGTPIDELLRIIAGHKLKTITQPPRYRFRNHPSCEIHKEWLQERIKQLRHKGIIVPIPERFVQLSCGISVLEGRKKNRIIFNGIPLNYFLAKHPFKASNIYDMAAVARPGDASLTYDMEKAFYQLETSPLSAPLTCFHVIEEINGKKVIRYYAYVTDNFGGSGCPPRFYKRHSIIINFFSLLGLRVGNFYDDSRFFITPHPLLIKVAGRFIQSVLLGLGNHLNKEKTDLTRAETDFEFIGFQVDTNKFQLLIAADKVRELEDFLQGLISGNRASPRDIAQVKGKLVSFYPAISMLSHFTKSLDRFQRRYVDAHNIASYDVEHPLPPQVLVDINYILTILHSHNGAPLWLQSWDKDVWSDASETHCGSHCDKVALSIPLPTSLLGASSMARELYGYYLAIKNREDMIRGKRVRIFGDNLGCVTALMRNSAHTPLCQMLCRKIAKLIHDLHAVVWFRWRPRDHPGLDLADKLSKLVYTSDWTFLPHIRRRILCHFALPQPSLDAFASAQNRTCERYIAQHHDGEADGVDFFASVNLCFRHIVWANPPFGTRILTRVVHQFITYKFHGYLLVPVWPRQRFWALARTWANSMILLPESSRYFKPGPNHPCAGKERITRWKIAIFYFRDYDLKVPLTQEKSPTYLFESQENQHHGQEEDEKKDSGNVSRLPEPTSRSRFPKPSSPNPSPRRRPGASSFPLPVPGAC